MGKNKKVIITSAIGGTTAILGAVIATVIVGNKGYKIVLDKKFDASKPIEYTGETMQMPLAHIEDKYGNIVSYDVKYSIVNTKSGKKTENKYASFNLDTGKYKLVYSYDEGLNSKKEIEFSVSDTMAPSIEFTNIPRGVFLQDITADDIQKLPLYTIEDASSNKGIDLDKKLYFKGNADTEYKEVEYRDINNSYDVKEFGTFKYVIKATDKYGNKTENSTEWLIKDREWKPDTMPQNGILADYSTDGYLNYFESGDANQYYKIGTDYEDSWLSEYEGAKGVLKADLSFNNAAGYGNNCVRLYFAKKLTKADLNGKYLAVRMRVEGKNIKDGFLFSGCNVAFREEDQTMRSFSTQINGLETDKWVTYYIDADLAEDIGVFPNAKYNPETTVYDGGEPANYLQLCFSRLSGYYNNMTLYVDSISIAEKLPDTVLSVSGASAKWTAVKGAVGYSVNNNGTLTETKDTSITLNGKKGYIKVIPLGDGVFTLDGNESNAVYGINTGNFLAKFDDQLYSEMISGKLNFSTPQENIGYAPKSLSSEITSNGLKVNIGTGYWGVCTGISMILPKPQTKGNNTSIVINMNVSNADYNQIRVYDNKGKYLSTIMLDSSNTGKMTEFKIDLSSYNYTLSGLQFIFGPSKNMVTVNDGVSVLFKNIALKNTYYGIDVNGEKMVCVGDKKLTSGYTTRSVVQFTDFFDFGAPADNTVLGFDGTVKLDGRTLDSSDFTVIGYKNNPTICFNVEHNGKVLTVLKGSKIYYNGKVAIAENTFNAKWDGKNWVSLTEIPKEPEKEYITVGGQQYTLAERLSLTAGYTTNAVTQFTNVCNFSVPADNTPIGFSGKVLLDGKTVAEPQFIAYKDNSTICLNLDHNKGQILTVMKDSVIYYGEKAVVVKDTFNAKWDGENWIAVEKIPDEPKTEYITVDGKQLIKEKTAELKDGYTAKTLVQFTSFYDFGVPADNTPLSFSGKILLDGAEVDGSQFNIIGYKNNTTVCLNINHDGHILTVMKDSVIYYGDKAVVVKDTFNAKWNGSSWDAVKDIPVPAEQTEIAFTYNSGAANYIQVKTDLPQTTVIKDFLTTENGSNILQSGSQAIGWIGMVSSEGSIYLSFNFNGNFATGSTFALKKDSVFGFAGGKSYTLDKDYYFTFDGNNWSVSNTAPVVEKNTVSFSIAMTSKTQIQVKTDLPSTTVIDSFLATDNGCNIIESGSQTFGWASMAKDDSGNIYICFVFNNEFTVGQAYTIGKGSVFGFKDGKKYTLDKTLRLTYTESGFVADENEYISFSALKNSNSKLITLETDLPLTTPVKDFLTTDNGCNITESGNKTVGWIGMSVENNKICLSFNFNSGFFKNQTYKLSKGSVFKFTDGSSYTLDKDYDFKFNGSTFVLS